MKKAILLVSFLALTAVAPFVLGDATRLGQLAFASFPAAAAINAGGLLWDTTNVQLRVSDGAAWRTVTSGPGMITPMATPGALAVATIGGGVIPQAFTVSSLSFRISVAGTVGSTNATLRVSDGTNNCDAAFACNSAIGNYNITATGTCAFASAASLTYSILGLGDCATPATVLGNVGIYGNWR